MQSDRKSTQRRRLLDAMIETTARDGYKASTIAKVIAGAGVSRPTFYDYFTDKADCFIAALTDIQDRLLIETARALRDTPPEQALQAGAQTLIAFAAAQPEAAKLLTSEALAGGPRTLQARDDGIEQLARIVEQAQQTLPPHTPTPDVSPRILLGTIHRLLARRLREGHDVSELSHDLAQWIDSYARPIGEHRFRTLQPTQPPAPWALLPEAQLLYPPDLHPGRRRITPAVAESQRKRIMLATAAIAQEKGYAASTIAHITNRAGVDRRAFNALFSDKQEAYIALISLGFQRTMAVTIRAFSTGADWPDRIWDAGRAFTQFFEGNPSLAHVGFVEPYAIGAQAASQTEGSLIAFTIFLTDSVRDAPETTAAANPRVLEAIAASIFETGYHESRQQRIPELSRLLPHVTFMCLAPVMGAQAANSFIEGKLDGAR